MSDQVIYLEKYIDSEWAAVVVGSGHGQAGTGSTKSLNGSELRYRPVATRAHTSTISRSLLCVCRHHFPARGAAAHPQLDQGSG
jgi:hypothetical protein